MEVLLVRQYAVAALRGGAARRPPRCACARVPGSNAALVTSPVDPAGFRTVDSLPLLGRGLGLAERVGLPGRGTKRQET